MSELIIREITPFGKRAKYGNVDLGSKENLSRGAAAVAGLVRVIHPADTHIVCVTFLPDTYHNRAVLLEKSMSEKTNMEIFVRGDDGKVAPLTPDWLEGLFGDMKLHAAKLEPALPPGASEDHFDNPDHDAEAGDPMTIALGAAGNPEKPIKPAPKKAAKTAKAKPSQPAPPTPPEADDESISIASLEDFLALSMKNQMLALAAGLPEELLQEIAVADAPGLEMDVKNAAFQRMNQAE